MKSPSDKLSEQGFTLPELLIAMVIGGVVMAGVIQLFSAEVKTHNTQFAVSRLQQNMRATMDYMIRYARMSGYDPGYVGAGFNSTLAGRLDFTCDVGTLNDASTTNDTIPNGRIDNNWNEKIVFRLSGSNIFRDRPGNSPVTVAEDIEALNFRYLDQNGNDTNAAADIRSIQIAMVGRTPSASGRMSNFTDTTIYTNQRGNIILPAQNDSVRRLLLTAEVKCRNLSL